MRLKNLLCSETSRFIYKINLTSLSLSPFSSHALLSLILNISFDPIIQSSVTYRKKSTGNHFTLNNLSHGHSYCFFQHIPRPFIWASGIIIPIKMGPKKKVSNESILLKSSWVECNFFPFSSPLLSLEFTRAQGSLLRMLKVALALTNERWHLDRVYGLISYQI